MTVNTHVAVLVPSEAVYVIVVSPGLKVYVPILPVPEPVVAPTITQVSEVMLQLSVTTGLGVLTETVQLPGTDVAKIFEGHEVKIGAVLSLMVTVKEQFAVPQLLVAVNVTVVIPLLKVEPLPVLLPEPVVAPEKM